ncbi:MAG: mechanosensitive ion channel domain-containing protein [Candidatus Peregrinibacteria bacterium]
MLMELIPQALAATGTAAQNASVMGANAQSGGGISGLLSYLLSHMAGWVGGILILVAFYGLAKIASQRAKEKIISSKGENAPENALVLVERLTKIGIMAIGIVIAGAINGINLGTVIGAISLAVGFALKDIISNIISSIVMLAQNRIRIGDFVQIGDIMGTIVSIDTRVTVIQSIDGSQVVVPNQNMLNQILISYTVNPFRRLQIDVGVDYNTDLASATALVKGVLDKHPDVVAKPPCMVLVNEFGDSSISLRVFFWIESKKNWQVIRSNVAYRIRKAFKEAGINIPFPIRTLKVDEDDRAFLKTMDSLKKGVAPEDKKIPSKDTLRQVAENIEHEPAIPEKLFEEKPMQPNPEVKPVPSIQVFKTLETQKKDSEPPTRI